MSHASWCESIELNLFVQEILDFCGLEDSLDKQYKNLSTGYKSRLAFAIATIKKPKILLLDEVLGWGSILYEEAPIVFFSY